MSTKIPLTHLLGAADVLEQIADELEAQFQESGLTFSREVMQEHASDRAALLRVRRLLINLAEEKSKEDTDGE